MRFVVEVGTSLYPIEQLDEHDFREGCKPDIVGMPVYCVTLNSAWFFWPRPLPDFKVYKLELWPYVDSKLP